MAALLLYRRLVSGRGPLRRVACSFADVESCSAFGLRACTEAQSLFQALSLIRRRLRRCRTAAVYRLASGEPLVLGWGEIYDDCTAAELDSALMAARERVETRAMVLATAARIASWRGQPDRAAGLVRRARACSISPLPPRWRDGTRVESFLVRRTCYLLIVALLLGGLAALLLSPPAAASVSVMLGLPVSAAVRGTIHRVRRFNRFRAAAAFWSPTRNRATLS
jgi:hypothetical protein